MKSIVLDTSVLISLERSNSITNDLLESANRLIIPTVVIAEFLQTAYKNSAPTFLLSRRLDLLEVFRTVATFADFDEKSAVYYAQLWALSIQRGKPKSQIDLQIAAIAKRHKAEVISFDERADFSWIAGLLD